MPAELQVVVGDITKIAVDVIVNAANSSLLGGGGVDGAIHRAAGPELAMAGRALGGCRPGESKITPAFRLQANFVIHTVGPVWQGGDHDEAITLSRCYLSALELASSHGQRSIAFPAISTGRYGYPKGLAAGVAVSAARSHAAETTLSSILFCCLGDEDADYYRGLL
jgi:O-acetyl-ADP-ribose deacetylase